MKQAALDTLIGNIKKMNVDLPATEAQLMKFRGVGHKTLKRLDALGLVKHYVHPFPELGVRAWNALDNLGITTQEQARQAIASGRIQKLRNYGPSTHREVCKWAGVPIDPPRPKIKKKCPHCGGKL